LVALDLEVGGNIIVGGLVDGVDIAAHPGLSGAHHTLLHAAAQHNAAALPGSANENLGAFYLDIDDIAVPANPGAGIRRLFVDTATGELSVRTSAGTTVSLEGALSGHDHTGAADGGVLTNDEHDGYSEYDEIATPANPAANKLRVYPVDVGGVTSLALLDSAGVETPFSAVNPRGVLAQTSSTTLVANSTGSETDCLTLAAITGDGTRRVRIVVYCWVATDTVANTCELRIKEGGTTLQSQQWIFANSGGPGQFAMVMLWEFVPTAASHTYKFIIIRTAGAGISQALAASTKPAFIMCEDIGL
ncbi:hypothetical protein LCGC14_2872910, partial [marine sediment metagenome]